MQVGHRQLVNVSVERLGFDPQAVGPASIATGGSSGLGTLQLPNGTTEGRNRTDLA